MEEISGVAFYLESKVVQGFKKAEMDIKQDNYKDDVRYFVMTAKKESLLKKVVLLKVN